MADVAPDALVVLFLACLRCIKLSPKDRLTARRIQEEVLSSPPDAVDSQTLQHWTDAEAKQAYIDKLKTNGVSFVNVSDEVAAVPWPDDQDTLLIPLFDTTSDVLLYRGSDEQQARAFLCRATRLLKTMGFWRAYAAVYVTDDMRRACRQLYKTGIVPLMDTTTTPVILTGFQTEEGGLCRPTLVIEYKGVFPPDVDFHALPACQVHEAIHLATHYLWRLNSYCRKGTPLARLLPPLIVEVFAQMQAAEMMGAAYVALGQFLAALQHAENPNLNPSRALWSKGCPLAGLRRQRWFEAEIFLGIFPWLTTTWVVGCKPPALIAIAHDRMWTERLRSLAQALKDPFMEIYNDCGMTPERYANIEKLFGKAGPCGSLFYRYAQALVRHAK